MTTYYLNGTPIVEGSDIDLNGFTYPYAWLEGTTPSVRASLGIEKIGDINYDPKYYWSSDIPKILDDREELDEEGNPAYVKVLEIVDGKAVMVESDKRLVTRGLKTTCLEEIRNATNQLLKPTDYYIIRNHTESIEIPSDVSAYRAAVVIESTRLQEAIPAVTTVEELISVMTSATWPKAE